MYFSLTLFYRTYFSHAARCTAELLICGLWHITTYLLEFGVVCVWTGWTDNELPFLGSIKLSELNWTELNVEPSILRPLAFPFTAHVAYINSLSVRLWLSPWTVAISFHKSKWIKACCGVNAMLWEIQVCLQSVQSSIDHIFSGALFCM